MPSAARPLSSSCRAPRLRQRARRSWRNCRPICPARGFRRTRRPARTRARLFDRSFAITYALEAIAILIGLAGVAATFSAQTVARIKEFGMMRHVGMGRGQIVTMLAIEGALLGLVGMAAGSAVGIALSQILIHVINPQSFNWTMTTRIPWGLIVGVATRADWHRGATAMIAGRQAVSRDAVRAVSEDW